MASYLRTVSGRLCVGIPDENNLIPTDMELEIMQEIASERNKSNRTLFYHIADGEVLKLSRR
jgi:hypothetical protein